MNKKELDARTKKITLLALGCIAIVITASLIICCLSTRTNVLIVCGITIAGGFIATMVLLIVTNWLKGDNKKTLWIFGIATVVFLILRVFSI